MDSSPYLLGVESQVLKLIEDLKSDSADLQRCATGELRLLSQCSENRSVIADCGVVHLLVGLIHSSDPATQVNAVTVLLNLSIDDRNKISIANANAIVSLIDVLRSGIPEAKENSAATLSSLAKIEENRIQIGKSEAIGPLVELLTNGTPRGKEDAVTALYNLSKCRANMVRIAQSGAVAHLVSLIDHAAAGLVDKAVTILANLATTSEGRIAIGQDGVSALVDVVELGSARGKENATAALLQLCRSSNKYCQLVLQQGAVPSLVALSHCGTPRAKEKQPVNKEVENVMMLVEKAGSNATNHAHENLHDSASEVISTGQEEIIHY